MGSLAFFWRVVGGRYPSKGRSRREKREEVWGELIGHCIDDGLILIDLCDGGRCAAPRADGDVEVEWV